MGPLRALALCLLWAAVLGGGIGVAERYTPPVAVATNPQQAAPAPSPPPRRIAARVTLQPPPAAIRQLREPSERRERTSLFSFVSSQPELPPPFWPKLNITRAASGDPFDTLAQFDVSQLDQRQPPRRRWDRPDDDRRLFDFLPRLVKRSRDPVFEKEVARAVSMTPTAGPETQSFSLNAAAYTALAAANELEALALFRQSLAANPAQPAIQTQVGYIEKARGNFAAASQAFAAAAAYSGSGRVQPDILRELNQVSRPLRLSAYTVWRQDSRQINDAAFGPSLAQSQSGIGASYLLPFDGWASLHGLSLTSRVLWAYEPESLSPDSSTAQAGVGVQLRPFKDLNLIASAERLIGLGNQARDDWLLRTSYSAGRGYLPPTGQDFWLHWSAYADAAIIDPTDPDIQLLGDARVGLGYRPLPNTNLSLIPFAGLAASYEDAAGRTTDLYEAAGGVWLRFWPGGPDIPDPARAVDLRLEYREKLGGDSPSNSGVRLSLGITY